MKSKTTTRESEEYRKRARNVKINKTIYQIIGWVLAVFFLLLGIVYPICLVFSVLCVSFAVRTRKNWRKQYEHYNFLAEHDGSLVEEITGYLAENATSYVVLDVETTGLDPNSDKIIEIGMIKVIDGKFSDEYETLVNPKRKLDKKITEITGLTDRDLQNALPYNVMAKEVANFIGELQIVAHNSNFDAKFVSNAFIGIGLYTQVRHIDTIKIAKKAYPELERYKLDYLIRTLNLSSSEQTHRAMDDVRCTLLLYEKCKKEIRVKELLHEEIEKYERLKTKVELSKTPVDLLLLYPEAEHIAKSAWGKDERSAISFFGPKEKFVPLLFEKKLSRFMKAEYERERSAIQKLKTRKAINARIEKFSFVYESDSGRLSMKQRNNLESYKKELYKIRDIVSPNEN